MNTVTSCHFALSDAGAAPEWVQLVPSGTFRGQDGRGPYRLSDPAEVIRASMAGGKLPIDENHATDMAMTTGQPSPARGWIVEMAERAGSVWGRVEWTTSGLQLMTEQAYRGISPVFEHDKKTGVVVRVLRAALTNTPNLPQLATLHTQQGPEMDLNQIRAALGLPETADEAACLAAITANRTAVTAHSAQIAAIAAAAGADPNAGADVLVVALQAQRQSAVNPDVVVALQTQLATLQNERARDKAVAFVDGAIAAGKPINPLRDHYIAQHMARPADIETQINALPSINAGGITRHAQGGGEPDGDEGLTAIEMQTCQRMGLDPKKYAANKKKAAEQEGMAA